MLQSESISEIAPALAEALPGLPHAKMDSANPHFKSRFASLKSILECRGALAQHGLFITQSVTPDSVISRIVHTSGQWIGSECAIKMDRDGPQAQGSAITYARRYSLSPLLGIYADEDDDGNAAERPQNAPQSPRQSSGGGDMGAGSRATGGGTGGHTEWRNFNEGRFATTCCVCGDTIPAGMPVEWNGERGGLAMNRHPGGTCGPTPVEANDIRRAVQETFGDDDIPFRPGG